MPTWVPTAQTCVASAAATPWNPLPSVPGFGEAIVLHPDPSRCAARVSFPDVPGRDPTAHTSSEAIAATLRRVEWSPPPRLSTMLHPVAVAAPLAGEPTICASDAVRRTAPSAAPQERFTGQSSERRHSL